MHKPIRSVLVKVGVFGLGLLFMVAGAFAHHSDAEFDLNNPTIISGTVTQFEFINPHVLIHLDVENDKGEKEAWTSYGGPPNAEIRIGWNSHILKPGDQVSILGFRSLYGRNVMLGAKVTRSNGEILPVGAGEQSFLDRAAAVGKHRE
jgi:Family of unknown function (DUF6152)